MKQRLVVLLAGTLVRLAISHALLPTGDPDDNQPYQQDGWMLNVEDELSGLPGGLLGACPHPALGHIRDGTHRTRIFRPPMFAAGEHGADGRARRRARTNCRSALLRCWQTGDGPR